MQTHNFKQEKGSHTWGLSSSKKWWSVAVLEYPYTSNEYSAFIFKGHEVHDRKMSNKQQSIISQMTWIFNNLWANSNLIHIQLTINELHTNLWADILCLSNLSYVG